MRRVLHIDRAARFGTTMSRAFIVDILQVVAQRQLALEEDSADRAGHWRHPVRCLHVHLQAPVMIESLSTSGALVSLANFSQQNWTFWVALFEVVRQLPFVLRGILPGRFNISLEKFWGKDFKTNLDFLPVHMETIWFWTPWPAFRHLLQFFQRFTLLNINVDK